MDLTLAVGGVALRQPVQGPQREALDRPAELLERVPPVTAAES